MVNYSQNLSEEYQWALDAISSFTGLELTLIEKVHLKRIIKRSIDANSRCKGRFSESKSGADGIHIFFEDFYGCPYEIKNNAGAKENFFHFLEYLSTKSMQEKRYDAVHQFFRIKQEEAHHP
jgi:hypothetical protein